MARLIAKIGVVTRQGGRMNRRCWQWFELWHEKNNIIRCSCRLGSVWHKHTNTLDQTFTGTECDHIRAVYQGRVHEEKAHVYQAAKVREFATAYGGTTSTVYRIIVSDHYREMFLARMAAIALSSD